MLFSTYTFLFVFLPLTLLGYFGFGRLHWRAATAWLTAASLVFYCWWKPDPGKPWSPEFLLLVVGSCGLNFLCGRAMSSGPRPAVRRLLVTAGVSANLLLLGYYKYLGIFAVWSRALTGVPHGIPHLVLPLAISFFTFLQIAFLVDVFRGDRTNYTFGDYLLFVTFFPHLVAGPLVHHRELISQFRPRAVRFHPRHFAVGLTLLAVGLFKKAVLADNLAGTATPIFEFAAHGGRPLAAGEAWIGALAYSLQIYFDFSGYSDMAVGISALFGLRLPINFDSPYRASDIASFWQRWHMTLSRFLRDYLYIPLGGNRRGPVRRYFNLMATMLFGGLWHGAGVTYVLWGVLHGIYLCVFHAWSGLRRARGWKPLPAPLGVVLTFLAVLVAWIPFRAGNFELASSGNAGLAWKTTLNFYHGLLHTGHQRLWPTVADGDIMKLNRAIRPMLHAFVIAFFLPNTRCFLRRFSPHFRTAPEAYPARRWWNWAPTPWFAVFVFVLFLLATLKIDQGGEFIYFQF